MVPELSIVNVRSHRFRLALADQGGLVAPRINPVAHCSDSQSRPADLGEVALFIHRFRGSNPICVHTRDSRLLQLQTRSMPTFGGRLVWLTRKLCSGTGCGKWCSKNTGPWTGFTSKRTSPRAISPKSLRVSERAGFPSANYQRSTIRVGGFRLVAPLCKGGPWTAEAINPRRLHCGFGTKLIKPSPK